MSLGVGGSDWSRHEVLHRRIPQGLAWCWLHGRLGCLLRRSQPLVSKFSGFLCSALDTLALLPSSIKLVVNSFEYCKNLLAVHFSESPCGFKSSQILQREARISSNLSECLVRENARYWKRMRIIKSVHDIEAPVFQRGSSLLQQLIPAIGIASIPRSLLHRTFSIRVFRFRRGRVGATR
jgi:hypothetical protein